MKTNGVFLQYEIFITFYIFWDIIVCISALNKTENVLNKPDIIFVFLIFFFITHLIKYLVQNTLHILQ